MTMTLPPTTRPAGAPTGESAAVNVSASATPESTAVPTTSDDRRRQTAAVVVVFVLAILSLVWIWTTLRPTSASFSDRETIEGNRLGAGTLDVEVGEQTIAFSAQNMAAGDTVRGQFEVVNAGSLPLRFDISSFAPASPLREILDIRAWNSSGACAPTPPTSAPIWSVLDPGSVAPTVRQGALPVGASRLICMVATLPLDSGPAAQGQRLDLIIGVDAAHDIAASEAGES